MSVNPQYNNPVRLVLLWVPVLLLDLLCWATDILYGEAKSQSEICELYEEEGSLMLALFHRLIYLCCFTLQWIVEILMYPLEVLSAVIHYILDFLKL